jgi:hypothetical protein
VTGFDDAGLFRDRLVAILDGDLAPITADEVRTRAALEGSYRKEVRRGNASSPRGAKQRFGRGSPSLPLRAAVVVFAVLVVAGGVILGVDVAGRPSGNGEKPATSTSSSTSTPGSTSTTSVTSTTVATAPANALIWCSGPKSAAVSFDGMHVDETLSDGPPPQSVKDTDVEYRGRTVLRTSSLVGPTASISAPGTSGDACIARMAGYPSPIALLSTATGIGPATTLELVYPNSDGKYVGERFGYYPGFDIRILDGSLAIVTGDPRFSFLFTDGAGSDWPIQILKFEGGHMVDVSTQFPSMIAADAASILRSRTRPWYRADGVYAFIGTTEAWVADECRLGNISEAWQAAEQQVAHGPYSSSMAKLEPNFIAELKADLVQWGYCPAAG